MPYRNTVGVTLEQWSPRAFLVAGGLFLASPAAKGLVLLTNDPVPEVTIALLVGSSLLVALSGLLGFYPKLAERVPRHAFAGVVTTVVAAGVTIWVFVWLILARVLIGTSYWAAPGSPPEFAFVSLVVTMAIGFSVVGTACLRAAVPSRTVGGLLSALAVPWVVLLGAGAVHGPALPAWISLSTYGAIPVGLLATGYVIRRNRSPVDHATTEADVTMN